MIRKALLAGLFALIVVACGSQDPAIWPEPHDAATASGVGGATSVASASAAVGTGGSGGASGSGGANDGGSGPGSPSESGSRLKARRYIGEDGSSLFLASWFDTQRSEVCAVYADKSSAVRCMPVAYGVPEYFLDAQCKVSVGQIGAVSCTLPAQYAPYGRRASGAIYPWTGKKLAVATVYLAFNAQCIAVQVQASESICELGPEIDPAVFVAFQIVTDP